MKIQTGGFLAAAALAAPLLALNGSAAFAQGAAPQVTVNGARVNFSGQPPTEQGGRVLVPLRGVLEKIGAYVEYDAASKTVVALRNDTRITLPIGGRQALVNGRQVPLDVPAQVLNGSTLVPLRFVAESLGAQVSFDVGTNTVAIAMTGAATSALNPPLPRGNPAAAPAEPNRRREGANEARLFGDVISTYLDSDPARIVIHVRGSGRGAEKTIPLRRNVDVTFERPSGMERHVAIARIRPAQRVSVLQDRDGYAIAVNILGPPPAETAAQTRNNPPVSGVFKGEFLDYSPRGNDFYRLKLTDGREIDVPKGVPILYNGQHINLDDLRSGDQITIAVDPVTRRGTRVMVAVEQ